MLRSILMGIVAGARSMTPLAAVSHAAGEGLLPEDDLPVRLLGHPITRAGTTVLAAAEIGGDKMKSAPDRIVVLGMLARAATASIAGAALAPKEQRVPAAILTTLVAFGSAHITWRARMKAMETHGQTPTGFIEDAIVAASAAAIVGMPHPA